MPYNREAARDYALKWAYGYNPDFYNFDKLGGDCTNFASQVLYAGGLPMNYTPTLGWYYISLNDRAPAWTGVNEFYRFLTTNTGVGPKAREVGIDEIQLADIVQINYGRDQSFDHTPVIVDVGEKNPETILLAAHSCPAKNRPLSTYDYVDVRFLHIIN